MSTLSNIRSQCLDASGHHLFQDLIQNQREIINAQDIENWSQIHSLSDWEFYKQTRIEALRQSLGLFPSAPKEIIPDITGQIDGDGYTIENIVFESRKNIFVSANRYLPQQTTQQMPGIILVNSHHNPKIQGELQDMGIIWAKSGCVVLVIDPVGYGERRDHRFAPRQDYWFRNITGLQLYTLGDSLMGWMVWDIHRCVDLLLSQNNIDPNKIIVMGSVAGGGDPCAVAATLDERISCAVPFNFGGPQPESPYPLPEDSETTFNYLGSGSWESTRNLRLSGRDGFLPWLIVGSIAPRHLIYAHEFEWDQERDPIWKRLQKIYAWYDVSDHLDHTQGFGQLQGRPPQASHCNNIGVPHRQRIYQALEKWYGITPPAEEIEERYEDKKLQSLTPKYRKENQVPAFHSELEHLGSKRASQAPSQLADLQKAWRNILGDITPQKTEAHSQPIETRGDVSIHRTILRCTGQVPIPLILLVPPHPHNLIVTIAQAGKKNLLAERSKAYNTMLDQGVVLCLPELPGIGETAPDGARTFRSVASSLSANLLMFGQTSLGSRLKALRTVLAHLNNAHPQLPISLWGDSLAPTNPLGFEDPLLNTEPLPHQAEPAGGLLALFATLFEPNIHSLAIGGMITGYQTLLENTYCYTAHDAILPGALLAGDLCDITPKFAPKPMLLSHFVDGRNCPVSNQAVEVVYHATRTAYTPNPENLTLNANQSIAQWFIQHLT